MDIPISMPPPGLTIAPWCRIPDCASPPPGVVCIWFADYQEADCEGRFPEDVASSPREAVPMYVREDTTAAELLVALRATERFRNTCTLYFRDLYHGLYESLMRYGRTTIREVLDYLVEAPNEFVCLCKAARLDPVARTKNLAKKLNLNYEKTYPFVFDTEASGSMNHHHFLVLQCPQLESKGVWLRAEMTHFPLLPGLNTYRVDVCPKHLAPHQPTVARAEVKVSLKHLDETFAHIVETHPTYTLKNINCQFFCDKSSKLLGHRKPLRTQWCDKILRLLGRSEVEINRRHSEKTDSPKCPAPGMRFRFRRWLKQKFS